MTLIDNRPWIHQDVLSLMIQDYVKFGNGFGLHFKTHAPRIELDFENCYNIGAYIAAIANQCFLGKFIPVVSNNRKLLHITEAIVYSCEYTFPDGKLLLAEINEESNCTRIKTNC